MDSAGEQAGHEIEQPLRDGLFEPVTLRLS